MICAKCGAAMPDDSVFCPQCGAAMAASAPEIKLEITPEAAEEQAEENTSEPAAEATENTPPEAEKTQYVYSEPSYQMPGQPQNTPPQYYNNGAQQPPYGEKPINSTTYLIFAILVTVMCCLPFGIPAIIYAAKIDKLQAMGDILGAKAAAKTSKMWSIIAGASILVGIIAYIIIIIFAAGTAAYSGGFAY